MSPSSDRKLSVLKNSSLRCRPSSGFETASLSVPAGSPRIMAPIPSDRHPTIASSLIESPMAESSLSPPPIDTQSRYSCCRARPTEGGQECQTQTDQVSTSVRPQGTYRREPQNWVRPRLKSQVRCHTSPPGQSPRRPFSPLCSSVQAVHSVPGFTVNILRPLHLYMNAPFKRCQL